MVAVVEVNLGELGVHLPRDQVGMVVAQPYITFTGTGPFTLKPDTVQGALEGIDETLNLARLCKHGGEKTHFTVFPECSIPGLLGVTRITETLLKEDWPVETIVIGGVDGLTRGEYMALMRLPNFMCDARNSVEHVRDDQWLNCCLTWVKLPTGDVRCYVQPKLAPAWVELNINHDSMYEGRCIYLFKGVHTGCLLPYRFATLLCFDWIGTVGGLRIWQWLLQSVDNNAAQLGATMPLTWLFVAQCNPAPSHASFMSQVLQFFDSAQYPNVNRANTCLIMANVAGQAAPGRAKDHGNSAVIFTPDRFVKPGCMPTYCNGGELQRPGSPLENFLDAVFRESGSCIHSFVVHNPDALPRGSAGRRVALKNPTVHSFVKSNDPRLSGCAIPAVVKWINDEIDDKTKTLAKKHQTATLAADASIADENSVRAFRALSATALGGAMVIARPGIATTNPDSWNDTESKAVWHLLNTFSILEVAAYKPTFHGNGAQATIRKATTILEAVAVTGKSHEQCDQHVKDRALPHRGKLLLVSRDEDNTRWNARRGTIFDQAASASEEIDITDPRSAVIHISYQQVLQAYLDATDRTELEGFIDAALK